MIHTTLFRKILILFILANHIPISIYANTETQGNIDENTELAAKLMRGVKNDLQKDVIKSIEAFEKKIDQRN